MMKKTTKFQAKLESLESREVLSHSHVAAALTSHVYAGHDQALVQRSAAQVVFHGNGVAVPSTISATATGYQGVATTGGTLSRLGSYNGLIAGSVTTAYKVDATAYLATANGDYIEMAIGGTLKTPRGNATTASGRLNFVIFGGTGVYANATGSGTLNGTANLTTFVTTYTLDGRIRV